MTGNIPLKRRGSSTFKCDACDFGFFKTHCILRVPEYEGYKSTLPCECPFKLSLKTKWKRWME